MTAVAIDGTHPERTTAGLLLISESLGAV